MEEFWFGLALFLRLLCFLSCFLMLDRLSLFSLTKGKLSLCGVWTQSCNTAHIWELSWLEMAPSA